MDEFRALRDLMLLYEESSGEIPAPSFETVTQDLACTTTGTCFKPKSSHFPDLLTCPNIWAFLQLTIRDLKSQQWSRPETNLTLDQSEALKSLQSRNDIVIKPSDKGGYIVTLSHPQYQSMCLNILRNSDWYCRIGNEQISLYANELRSLCTNAYLEGLIDQNTLDYLNPKFPRVATFYTLPKVHKDLSNPPGRPIFSRNESLTEKASRYSMLILC